MATTNETLAQVFARLRRDAGLSLRQLQESSGVDRGLISRIENGEVLKPSPSNLNRLAVAMSVETAELLKAAGHIRSEAEVLPAIRPYLRTKYGHLSAASQDELAAFLEKLEAEEDAKRAGGRKSQ